MRHPLLVILSFTITFLSNSLVLANDEIRLWPKHKTGPGSEHWDIAEKLTITASGERIISNVSDPTLSVFLPNPDLATGAAVIIAPGGGFRVLAIDNEGEKIATWLNSKGIAAFVLKYRTLQQADKPADAKAQAKTKPAQKRKELDIRNANANPAPENKVLSNVISMAVADAQQALRYVRNNSKEWNIDKNRIGIMGFSAGGGVAVGTVLAEKSDASPNFIVSVYGPSLMDVKLPEHTPPLFIAVGSTHFNVTNGCLALFQAWKSAGKPAEMHVYDQVGGPFGMSKLGLPVDAWTERLIEWMVARKLSQ